MSGATARQRREDDDPEVMLGLLSAVAADETVTQRSLAVELGIALGLVNAYVRRCIGKGLIKVHDAPARRYAYYLTPKGFAEKSRLTLDYLSHSLGVVRRARQSCAGALGEAAGRGWRRVVVIGAGELAEIAALSALESPVRIVAVWDPGLSRDRFAGLPVIVDPGALDPPADGAILTASADAGPMLERAIRTFGAERVLVPDLLAFAVSPGAAAPANANEDEVQ